MNNDRPPYNNNRPQRPTGQPQGQRTPQNRQLPQTERTQYTAMPQNNGQHQYRRAPQTPYPPVRHRSRKQAQKAMSILVLSVVILAMLLVAVIIFATRCATGFGESEQTQSGTDSALGGALPNAGSLATDPPELQDGTTPTVSGTPSGGDQPVTGSSDTQQDAAYDYIEMMEADVHKGYQILINYQYPYNFEGDFKPKNLYTSKNGYFKVNNTTDTLDSTALTHFLEMMTALSENTIVVGEETMKMNDIIITSSDRTYEYQEQLYAEFVDRYGEEYAQLYVAKPGHSEHHTGLAADLAIYTDGGHSYTFNDLSEYPDWLRANAHKYGFIERYQADKTEITKIAYENWHYRYIGKPHAFYINANSLCLEEYIDLLRGFAFKDKHLSITDDEGQAWEIYFVRADTSGTTKVPVPKHFEYEVSGNNVDGFIVTVKK